VTRLRELATGFGRLRRDVTTLLHAPQLRTDGQIGLEDTVEDWVERLRSVMAEIHRVLAPTGSAWVDLGDSYSRGPRSGAPAKSLLLAPERLALALVAERLDTEIESHLGEIESDARPRSPTD